MKLMVPLIVGFIALSVPVIVMPATDKDASSLGTVTDEVYGGNVDTEALKLAIFKAVDEGIPSEVIETLLRESARFGTAPEEVSSYIEIASDLHSNGIPSEHVFNTVLEGFVKGVDDDKMKLTINRLRSRLLFCNEIAQRHSSSRGGKESRHELLLNALFYTMNTGFS